MHVRAFKQLNREFEKEIEKSKQSAYEKG